MKIVIATKNQHKLVEFRRILEPLGYEVLSQADVHVDVDVEETGTTFEENAALKARAVYEATGMVTVADDSGIAVDALDGAPGVYSARYGNVGSDLERTLLLLKNMEGVPKEQRTARYVCVIHVVFSPDDQRSYRGECEGWIGYEMQGENGFGYDPIFMINETETFAMVDSSVKDQMSHRGKALRMMEEDFVRSGKIQSGD